MHSSMCKLRDVQCTRGPSHSRAAESSCGVRFPDEFSAGTSDPLGHDFVPAPVRMDLVALQIRIGDDAAQHPRNEKAPLILCHARVHLLVIQTETRKTKTEEDDHRAGAVDLANDRPKVAFGSGDIHAAKEIVAAEPDDDDARIAREDVGVDARQRHVGRVAADAGVNHRFINEPR